MTTATMIDAAIAATISAHHWAMLVAIGKKKHRKKCRRLMLRRQRQAQRFIDTAKRKADGVEALAHVRGINQQAMMNQISQMRSQMTHYEVQRTHRQ